MTTLFAVLSLICATIGLWAEVRIRRLTEERDSAIEDAAFWKRMHLDVCNELQQAREWNEAHK